MHITFGKNSLLPGNQNYITVYNSIVHISEFSYIACLKRQTRCITIPKQEDLSKPLHVSKEGSYLWAVRNYRGEVYLRTQSNPPKWRLVTSTYENVDLPGSISEEVQNIYGWLVEQHPEYHQACGGYVTQELQNGAMVSYPCQHDDVSFTIGQQTAEPMDTTSLLIQFSDKNHTGNIDKPEEMDVEDVNSNNKEQLKSCANCNASGHSTSDCYQKDARFGAGNCAHSMPSPSNPMSHMWNEPSQQNLNELTKQNLENAELLLDLERDLGKDVACQNSQQSPSSEQHSSNLGSEKRSLGRNDSKRDPSSHGPFPQNIAKGRRRTEEVIASAVVQIHQPQNPRERRGPNAGREPSRGPKELNAGTDTVQKELRVDQGIRGPNDSNVGTARKEPDQIIRGPNDNAGIVQKEPDPRIRCPKDSNFGSVQKEPDQRIRGPKDSKFGTVQKEPEQQTRREDELPSQKSTTISSHEVSEGTSVHADSEARSRIGRNGSFTRNVHEMYVPKETSAYTDSEAHSNTQRNVNVPKEISDSEPRSNEMCVPKEISAYTDSEEHSNSQRNVHKTFVRDLPETTADQLAKTIREYTSPRQEHSTCIVPSKDISYSDKISDISGYADSQVQALFHANATHPTNGTTKNTLRESTTPTVMMRERSSSSPHSSNRTSYRKVQNLALSPETDQPSVLIDSCEDALKSALTQCVAPSNNSSASLGDRPQTKTKSNRTFFQTIFGPSEKKGIFAKLREKFLGMYDRGGDNMSLLQSTFPRHCNFHDKTLFELFDLTVQCKGSGGKVKSESDIFTKPSDTSNKRILVQSDPRFGKTSMCHILSYHWRCGKGKVKDFELCICLKLEFLNKERDLASAIIFFCTSMLNERKRNNIYEEHTIRNVLLDYSHKVIILIDGYNQMTEEDKSRVRALNSPDNLFKKSTILITSRFGEDDQFLNSFDRHVIINGFSSRYLSMLLRAQNPYYVPRIFDQDKDTKYMTYMSELSPFFTCIMSSMIAVKQQRIQKYKSLYEFLNYAMPQVAITRCQCQNRTKCSCSGKFDDAQLHNFFFHALLSGQQYLRDQELLLLPEASFKFLLNCNVLYKDKEQYGISSKLLMTFFATKYIRKIWEEAPVKYRKRILGSLLCPGGCTNDYIMSEEDNTSYYVGLIPEIVVKCHKNTLEDGTIEMYHDVDGVELSQSFDSVNLLLRVTDRFLPRFHFHRFREDHQRPVKIFGQVLNILATEKMAIELKYFFNSYEDKYFLKVCARGSEESEDMYIVARANENGVIDKMYIDFSCSNLDDVFDCVKSVLVGALKKVDIYDGLKYKSLEEFVFSFVWEIFQSDFSRPISVVNGGNIEKGSEGYKANLTFKMYPGKTKHVVFIRDHFYILAFTNSESVKYTKEGFWKNKSDITKIIQDCHKIIENPKICITLM